VKEEFFQLAFRRTLYESLDRTWIATWSSITASAPIRVTAPKGALLIRPSGRESISCPSRSLLELESPATGIPRCPEILS